MELRAHHILCIQKFSGKGYSENFVKHMKAVVSLLKKAPETEITIVGGYDELCRECPENKCGVCSSAEKTNLLDSRTLDVCGIDCGVNAIWSEIALKAKKLIFETDKFEEICGSCSWIELCRNTEAENE